MFNIKSSDEIVCILKMIQNFGFESAIIAGGAIRDLYFNQMFRDVDIFVWDPKYSRESLGGISHRNFKDPTKLVNEWTKILQLNLEPEYALEQSIIMGKPLKDNICTRTGHYDERANHKITMVIEVLRRLIPYEIIYTKHHPIDHVNKYFNIGICKAYCDGTKFRFTSDFLTDAQNKTLTIVGEDMNEEEWNRTFLEHIPRLQSKYPNFQVKIAPHNEKFVKF